MPDSRLKDLGMTTLCYPLSLIRVSDIGLRLLFVLIRVN
jgi:hypothetical protein